MRSSSSSSAQAARQRLGGRLRALREESGLNGLSFAREAGWKDSTNVSQVELGKRAVTAEHVKLWCRVCGASEGVRESLLAEQANVANMWLTYEQLNRGGLKAAQESVREKYERLRLLRVYQSKSFPGLLQGREYLHEILTGVWDEQAVRADDREADIAAAVAERLDRQSVLNRPGKRFVFVVEEIVLRYRTITPEAHRAQLAHLLNVMRLPSVSLGIIPMDADRHGARPRETFIVTDDRLVNVELVSGYLSLTDPKEVGEYLAVWETLFGLAVHGDACAELIEHAGAALP
ncbi:helix-turn-helix transcriptional regulator [Actinocorallia sp. A-T 12471]|uniref:helix-turn-helix domain-containing protein n=1 Tax=Actinocorallia sp. A-T 12471 TaxID=3089813 RepID=UPI0029D19EE2|nr:helix-turn-helix transcriptional regulator [Actinocorallia sp. A-T 12471]MDX6745085.1 helix-turn-helix transcriptional regulator [Actinocorallia sp. A-T 12471]